MIINNIAVPVNTVAAPGNINVTLQENSVPFPIMILGRGSYIVGAQIQSMLNFDIKAGIHNIQIGAFCSLADDVTFMVNMNHDYDKVTTSADALVSASVTPCRVSETPRKGQILIQNDVWIGHGATLFSGVTVHNGAVIAANANVTKDVPPYAIVGGNPARVLKHRFAEEQILQLLNIAWWDWDSGVLSDRREDFGLSVHEFAAKYHVSDKLSKLPARSDGRKTFLFFVDFTEPYRISEKVIRAYCLKFGTNLNTRMLLYIPDDGNAGVVAGQIETLAQSVLGEGNHGNDNIVIQVGHMDTTGDEARLFAMSDIYITTRALETVRRSCLADLYGVKTISGVDEPLFWNL
jgi:virginiamycin A acetyltransferase